MKKITTGFFFIRSTSALVNLIRPSWDELPKNYYPAYTISMFASGSIVSSDILDIGTRRYDENKRRSMTSTGGSAAIAPPSLVLGEPAAFDIPNVPDVSDHCNGLLF